MENLLNLRKKLNVTQLQIGRETGFANTQISMIENGLRHPKLNNYMFKAYRHLKKVAETKLAKLEEELEETKNILDFINSQIEDLSDKTTFKFEVVEE